MHYSKVLTDSATLQSSPQTGLANELSAVGVLTSLVRFDRFEGTACLFHL
jgi:hypothetical protein